MWELSGGDLSPNSPLPGEGPRPPRPPPSQPGCPLTMFWVTGNAKRFPLRFGAEPNHYAGPQAKPPESLLEPAAPGGRAGEWTRLQSERAGRLDAGAPTQSSKRHRLPVLAGTRPTHPSQQKENVICYKNTGGETLGCGSDTHMLGSWVPH